MTGSRGTRVPLGASLSVCLSLSLALSLSASLSLSTRPQRARRNVQRFREGLVFKAHRLLYHSTLGVRVIEKKKRGSSLTAPRTAPAHFPQNAPHTAPTPENTTRVHPGKQNNTLLKEFVRQWGTWDHLSLLCSFFSSRVVHRRHFQTPSNFKKCPSVL